MPGSDAIQYLVEGQQKNLDNIKAKTKKKTDIDEIWQSQTSGSVSNLRLTKMRYGVLKLNTFQRDLS